MRFDGGNDDNRCIAFVKYPWVVKRRVTFDFVESPFSRSGWCVQS